MKYISISFSACCFIFLLVLIYAFFSRNRVKSNETRVYTFLIAVNCALLLTDIIGFFFYSIPSLSNFIKIVISKIYLIIYILFNVILVCYTNYVIIGNEKKARLQNVFLIIYYVLLAIMVFYSPLEIVYHGDFARPDGPALIISFINGPILITYFLIVLTKNRKKMNSKMLKKLSPLFFLIGLGIFAVVIQNINSDVVLLLTVDTVSTFIMYFTIENPDVKMLEEFRIAKDRAEKANEEKEIFLYDITQDIRMPLYDIRKASNWLNDNIKDDNVIDASRYINTKTNSILDKVNNVLDISNMELTKIKVYNTKYSIKNLMNHLSHIYKSSDKVEIKFEIDSNIPENLYGDTLRLKQLMQVLLDNACKYTEEGLIEVKLNTIVKKEVCRLILRVEDTGVGIRASEIEEVFNKENKLYNNLDKIDDNKKNLAIAKSIATLLGGTLLMESELGSGTKMTLVLDQKIYNEKSKEREKLELDTEKYVEHKKVMIVSEDEDYLEKAKKKISKYEVEVECIDLGAKCLEKIRLNKKYDLILMDEELNHLTPMEIMNKLKKIQTFKTPVIILTSNTENKGYEKVGFEDTIDRKLLKKELDEVIDKIA